MRTSTVGSEAVPKEGSGTVAARGRSRRSHGALLERSYHPKATLDRPNRQGRSGEWAKRHRYCRGPARAAGAAAGEQEGDLEQASGTTAETSTEATPPSLNQESVKPVSP